MTVTEQLIRLQDPAYKSFQSKLIPSVDPVTVIGIRVPALRKLAKQYFRDPEHENFMSDLPHAFYDENMLHALLICQMTSYEECMEKTEAFLPYIDNWAVCDILSPKIFKAHKEDLLVRIRRWCASGEPYTQRFGMEMLMTWFLDEDFKPEYPEIPAAVQSEHYYVRMMTAWYYATALAKQWDAVIPYIEENRLDKWTHNKTIQKAVESYRITADQKNYLRTLKRKG